MADALAVAAIGLVKVFGSNRAVDGVDLQVKTGSVYGVLGPNGAGKTTTISMLATLLRPDQGSARIFGHDVVREPHIVRQLIGVTGQYASVDATLSALIRAPAARCGTRSANSCAPAQLCCSPRSTSTKQTNSPTVSQSLTTATIVPPAQRHLRQHPSIAQTVQNSLTMAGRGLIKIRRTPEQLFDVVFQPIIFTVMFAYIFGGAIAGDVASYIPYLIPGILVQT